MSKKVLLILSNSDVIGPNNRKTGNFLPEVAHPFEEFSANGYQVDFASVKGGTPPLDALDLTDDPINVKFLEGDGLKKMQETQKFEDVDTSNYDAIFIPGGLAPMVDMYDNPELEKLIVDTYERDAVVGAVCHGPAALLNAKLSDGTYLLKDKDITAFSNAEEEGYAKEDVPFMLETALTNQGAKFHSTTPWKAYSIADGNLVTGQNPDSAQGVAEKMIALMER